LGGPGKVDDINATWNFTGNTKNGNYSATKSYTHTLSYIGNGYNVNVSTKINSSLKGDSTGTNTSNTNNTTITKYNLLNTDSGFNINLTGVYSHSQINNGVISDKTSFSKVALTTTDYKLTGVNVSYDTPHYESGNPIQLPNASNIVNVTAMQDDLIANVVPNLMNGNNSITVTNKEGVQIDAGAGKDTVIGAIGNDTIIGGAGSDKLTGGKGTDTFSFSNADFYTENAKGDSVFNKSADTITDFNLKEHDVLDFGDLGELSFYAKLADAKADNAHLFYVKGSGSIYLNTSTTDGFTPTVIITLTGKPALNADGTDWNYPA
jgi:Ca2+-binding RTX toxin-like protein